MEDDEAVEKGVVILDCGCYLGPACRRDGGRIEEDRELIEGVADVAGVFAWWGAETGEVFFGGGIRHYGEGFWSC